MDFSAVEKIADAVLYEGYLLYPYRTTALKNRQRFNFGVLYPPACCEGSDASGMLTEVIAECSSSATIHAKVRFLQLRSAADGQEGVAREVEFASTVTALAASPLRKTFHFENGIEGSGTLTAVMVAPGLFRISLRVCNTSSFTGASVSREEVLLRSLISAHAVLGIAGGEFVSLLETPERFQDAAQACRNEVVWPVLVGDRGSGAMMLASPIILYDYPEIAPESPGDMFDGTEIDELLALRVLTLTDEEKREIRGGDNRAREILERTETMPVEQFEKLHGALRGMRNAVGKKE
jgi:hypothetical protein